MLRLYLIELSIYTEFKMKMIKENQQGKGPFQISDENGFDLTVIGTDKPKENLNRFTFTVKKDF